MVKEKLCEWLAARQKSPSGINYLKANAEGVSRWIPSIFPILKCNVDATFCSDRRITGFGMVIRDSNGMFIACRTATRDGLLDVREREAFGLLDALSWVRNLGYQQTIFELDAKSVLINAVDFCHSRGVYHRDLKPENLLLDENENLKVSDFGLSALAESKRSDGLLHTTCGTPAYVAPEVLERKGYDGAIADIWSCGVILFVMLAGYLPFHDSNLMELYRKIGKAEYRCPSWFSPEVRRLLSRILDPNPNNRISIARIRGSSWFKRGLNSKPKTNDPESSMVSSSHAEAFSLAADDKQEALRLSNLNAFDIISLSDGFHLSRLFEESCTKKESRFISWKPANAIISKLEEVAKRMKLKINKKDGGLFRFEGSKEGRKGKLCVDAEIFLLTPEIHLVEVKKTSGDTLEYEKILDEGIRPGLQDIVWSSQDESQPQQRYEQLEVQNGHPQPLTLTRPANTTCKSTA
ncbi:hypothetical protein DH2020_044546 [Rehmannia glutinosa]|uniref:non-specific serine/threonine protein kinase n=1 Tax=Rehmannia glutinosa TaxID=99300 RepID=A0ABR0UGV1_REHGL